MTIVPLSGRPPRVPEPQFATITPEQISALVDEFYALVRHDQRLGPIFEARVQNRWPVHLDRMKTFWRSVLLKSGEYAGQPVAAHMTIKHLREDDFRLWLKLFEQTAAQVFHPEATPHVISAARRIGRSLWLSRFGGPFKRPPAWLD